MAARRLDPRRADRLAHGRSGCPSAGCGSPSARADPLRASRSSACRRRPIVIAAALALRRRSCSWSGASGGCSCAGSPRRTRRRIGRAWPGSSRPRSCVALLAATAGAFALTEGAKLELSPIYRTQVAQGLLARVQLRHGRREHRLPAAQARPPHRLDGARTASGSARSSPGRSYPAGLGARSSSTASRDAGLTLPDGIYRPVVHLAGQHRTIKLPNLIALDTKPPVVRVRAPDLHAHLARRRRPQGRLPRPVPPQRARHTGSCSSTAARSSSRASSALHGVLAWNGKIDGRLARPGNHVLQVSAEDAAGNRAKPFPFAVVHDPLRRARPRRACSRSPGRTSRSSCSPTRGSVSWLLQPRPRRVARPGHAALPAPKKPGVYRLYVTAAGHAAKALVVVA